MLRTGLVVIALVFALQCQASAQGFLDSIFGPSGLGLWGDSFTSQFNSPEPYAAGNQMPGQMPYQGYPQAPGAQQQYYPPQQGYAPQQYAPQGQSYYPQPEGQVGAAHPQQDSSPQQYASPQQYGGQQYAPQQQAPVQQFSPQQQAAPTSGQATNRTQRAPAASGLRPRQYSPTPQLGAPGQLPISADDLPPGAVSISTTTPEGTRVEYYPPAGEQAPPTGVRQRPRQQKQSTPSAAQPRRIQQREQMTSESGTENSTAPIAMPKPVEIPGGQDPRSGWGGAVNQGPAPQGKR
ncbi:MAG: hypothetical protein ACLQPD_11175 [Desulfomonilaceae bacterium]